jgi:DNA-binding ferritin-like protein (Dps family)
MEFVMKKNILFSLALCAGLLLPQGSFASQSWSDWGMQGLKSAAQAAYSYLPSASSLSNWATNLVNSLSDEQKNSLRVALGMSAAFTAAGSAGYYYTQRQQELPQEIERLKKDLELDKGSTPTVGTVGKIAFFYKPGRESVQDKALEQIFKEDICPYLKTLKISPTSFNMQLLKSLKSLLEKADCNQKDLVEILNQKITDMTEEEMEQENLRRFENKIQREQAGIVKRSAQWVSEAAPTSVPFIAEKKVKLELSPEQFETKVVAAQETIENLMQEVGNNEANSGTDQTGITVAVIATIIGNCGIDKSKLQNASFEKYFEENVCQVFDNEEFNNSEFSNWFAHLVLVKTTKLYPALSIKEILKSFRSLIVKGACNNTEIFRKCLDLMMHDLMNIEKNVYATE